MDTRVLRENVVQKRENWGLHAVNPGRARYFTKIWE